MTKLEEAKAELKKRKLEEAKIELQKKESAPVEFGKQFMRGLSDMVAPAVNLSPAAPIAGMLDIDLADSGEEMAELFPSFVSEEEPVTLSGFSGRMAGVTAGVTVPFGGGASLVPKAAQGAGKVRGFFQNLVSDFGKRFSDAPVKTTAVESTVYGSAAGAGGFVAHEMFPGSDAAKITGEIIGGILPSFAPTRLMMKAAAKTRDIVLKPFTKEVGAQRGTQRIQDITVDPVAAERGLDEVTTIDPATGQPVLTPSQRTGDVGLLSLEKAVQKASGEFGDEQIANANRVIQESAKEIGEGTVEDAQNYLKGLLDTWKRITARKIDQKVSKLDPNTSRQEVNLRAAEAVNESLDEAVKQEKQLFEAIPAETPVPTTSAQAKLNEIIRGTGRPQLKDIPQEARKWLDPNSKEYLGEVTTIQDLRALQSDLRRIARNARSGNEPNFNQARIADEIADSITEDIANNLGGDEITDAVSVAVSFSREVKQSFRRGTMGKILKTEVAGERAIAPDLILERTIAGSGPRSRSAYDQIVQALDNPSIVERTGGSSAEFKEAASDFLRFKFTEKAVRNGQVSPKAAQDFIDGNSELLNRLPELRKELESAVQTGRIQTRVTRFDNPKVSKTALFIQKGPDKAFEEIGSLQPGAAAREMQKLVNAVKKDSSGEALSGLKSGFTDYLLGRARIGARDVEGERFVSGFELRDVMSDPSIKAAMNRLYSKEELSRLNTIMRDLMKLEKARSTREAAEGVIADRPAKLLDRVARILGAGVGRQTSRTMGVGGTVQIPGQVGSIFSDMVKAGIKDPANRFIMDSIQDEQLYRQVLNARLVNEELPERSLIRLRTWALAVIAEHHGTDGG